MSESDLPPLVYLVKEGSDDFDESMKPATLERCDYAPTIYHG